MAERDSVALCSCCLPFSVHHDFIVLRAAPPPANDDAAATFVRRLTMRDQAAIFAKLRDAHR